MEHAAPFYDKLALNTSPTDFETTLLDVNPIGLEEVSVFQSLESAILLERLLQILHILRNLSFLSDNAVLISRDHNVLTNLAKSVALPSVSYLLEVKKHAFDIFENMSSLIQLRGPSDFYFACLKKSLFEEDRALILSSIRALTKLCLNPLNEKVVLQLEPTIISRLVQFLLVPDEEVVMMTMEFFYNYSSMTEGCAKMPSCAPFNLVRLLIKFVHWKGVERSNVPTTQQPRLLPSRPAPTGTPAGAPSQQKPGQAPAPFVQDPSNPLFNAALWYVFPISV
jgi:hypothetical protein